MTRINHQVNVAHAFTAASNEFPHDIVVLINSLCSPINNGRGTLRNYNFAAEEILAFWEMSLHLSTINVMGTKHFPGELSERYFEAKLDDRMLDLLKDYYEMVYADCGYKFHNGINNIGRSCIYYFLSKCFTCW